MIWFSLANVLVVIGMFLFYKDYYDKFNILDKETLNLKLELSVLYRKFNDFELELQHLKNIHLELQHLKNIHIDNELSKTAKELNALDSELCIKQMSDSLAEDNKKKSKIIKKSQI